MRWTAITAALLAIGLVACDDAGDSVPAECSVAVGPSSDDGETLQTAFIEASSGDVVCLKAGTYDFTRELTISNHRDITVKGIGDTRDDVILDFDKQTVGDDAITVTADGFVIENLTIKNSPGNGIVVHAEESIFRNIKVMWDAGSVVDNGAYAVYPNDCKKTIIEDSEIIGAADAGIYVGVCEFAIVRRNKVHANVAGIELENSLYSDVYDNEVYDNSVGILAFALPNLSVKTNRSHLIRDNNVYDNNRANFAEPGTIVAFVPSGLGFLVMSSKDIEIRDNTISDNGSTGVLVVSYTTYETLSGTTNSDTELEIYTERVYIHDNTWSGNGADPQGAILAVGNGTPPLEDVLWDGTLREGATDMKICLGSSPAGFMNIKVEDDFSGKTTDTTGHTCTLPALPEMSSFADMVAP